MNNVMHCGHREMTLLFLMSVSVGIPIFAQTARQGDPNAVVQSTEFHSPMILDTVFAAADRSLWAKGRWFTVKDYLDLGKFSCDGVSLGSDYNPSTGRNEGIWKPGLELKAKQVDEAHVRVTLRVRVHNPRHNHDKLVNLIFEVFNGDELVDSARIPPIKAEDNSADVLEEVIILLPLDALKTVPMTRLRITMRTVDD